MKIETLMRRKERERINLRIYFDSGLVHEETCISYKFNADKKTLKMKKLFIQPSEKSFEGIVDWVEEI